MEIEHRPAGFMLLGFFISPDEGPPQPPLRKLHQPTASSSFSDSVAKPNHRNPRSASLSSSNSNSAHRQGAQVPSLVEEKPLFKRLVLNFNRDLFSPAIPNPLFCNPERERGPLSPELRRLLVSMGVAEDHTPTHFFTRNLFPSDVKKGLTRLTIPKTQLLRPFLTDQEEALLQERDISNNLRRLEVDVVDPLLVVRILSLSRWNYNNSAAQPDNTTCSWSYALNGGWMDVVHCNGLAAGDTIQVWSFRKTDASLGFVIFKEDKGSSTMTASGNDNGSTTAWE